MVATLRRRNSSVLLKTCLKFGAPLFVVSGLMLHCRRMARRDLVHTQHLSVGVAASSEKMFAFVTDLKKRPQWQSLLNSTEKLTNGPLGVTSRFRECSRNGRMVFEIIEYEPPKRFAYKDAGGPLSMRVVWSIEPDVNGGTQIAAEYVVRPRGYMKPLWPVVHRSIANRIGRDFAAFSRIVKEELMH